MLKYRYWSMPAAADNIYIPICNLPCGAAPVPHQTEGGVLLSFHIPNHRHRRRLSPSILLAVSCLTVSGCGDLTVISRQLLPGSTTAAVSAKDLLPDDPTATPSEPDSSTAPGSDSSTGSGSVSDSASGSSDTVRSDYQATQTPLYESLSYFIPRLSPAEYSNFTALYQGILSFQDTIPLPVPASAEEVGDLMALLSSECPELIQLDSVWSQRSNLFGSIVSISPSYLMDEETYRLQRGAVENLLESFQTQLAGASQYQIELTLFDSLINRCLYSTEADGCQTAYGAWIGGLAKCDGRAKALVWGLRSFGITASVITGSEHAWVIANIEGYFYNVDPTYDDNESDGIQQPCAYAHFNVPEVSIADDPYPADEMYQRRGYPPTGRFDANYHVRSGLWISAGQDPQALFYQQLAAAAAAGSGSINIRFESADDLNAALASYTDWIQAYLNANGLSCSITSYDYSSFNILFLQLTFS